jgi:L-aminopeptidase/D-esterase-like protein
LGDSAPTFQQTWTRQELSAVARARDYNIEIGSLPTGPNNAITDVAGVRVDDFAATSGPDVAGIAMLANRLIDGLFYATIEATEEAIVNAMFAADTMEGPNGLVVSGLPREQTADLVHRYRALTPN